MAHHEPFVAIGPKLASAHLLTPIARCNDSLVFILRQYCITSPAAHPNVLKKSIHTELALIMMAFRAVQKRGEFVVQYKVEISSSKILAFGSISVHPSRHDTTTSRSHGGVVLHPVGRQITLEFVVFRDPARYFASCERCLASGALLQYSRLIQLIRVRSHRVLKRLGPPVHVGRKVG